MRRKAARFLGTAILGVSALSMSAGQAALQPIIPDPKTMPTPTAPGCVYMPITSSPLPGMSAVSDSGSKITPGSGMCCSVVQSANLASLAGGAMFTAAITTNTTALLANITTMTNQFGQNLCNAFAWQEHTFTRFINRLLAALDANRKQERDLIKGQVQALVSALNTQTNILLEQDHAHKLEEDVAATDTLIQERLSKVNQSTPIAEAKGSPMGSIVDMLVALSDAERTAQSFMESLFSDLRSIRFSDERRNQIVSLPLDQTVEFEVDGETYERPDPDQPNAFREGIFPMYAGSINPLRMIDRETTPDGYKEDVRLAFQAMTDLTPPPNLKGKAKHSRAGQLYEAERRAREARMAIPWQTLSYRLAENLARESVPAYIDHIWFEILGNPGKAETVRSTPPSPDNDWVEPPGVVLVEQRDGSYKRQISPAAIRDLMVRQYTQARDFSVRLSNMTQPIGVAREQAEMKRVQLMLEREIDFWLEQVESQLALQNTIMTDRLHREDLERLYEDATQTQN